MSQELLYTSAPEGLNPSDQGFCTVACTQGMPRNLKEVLENLSGYRQADQPPHPVNYSHLIHTVGGKRYQILSRVSDYEKDYSGRTNKLAHHVALTLDELPPSGPAALLDTPLFQTHWDGQTRWIPQGPVIPVASDYQGPCRTWEAITGDAGWAGILAESAADGSQRPMYVIFSPDHDPLALVREAFGVLPPEKAWATSFSTYFTKLPAGVNCLWRFVLDGSPEARQARGASHSRVIDLPELERRHRMAPAGNTYVEAARAGQVVALETPAMVPSAATHSAPLGTVDSPTTVAAPSATSPSPYATASHVAAPVSPFGKSSATAQKSPKMLFLLGGVAGVLLIGVGVLVYSMVARDIPPPVVTTESETDKREPRPRPQKKFISERQKKKNELSSQKTVEPKLIAKVEPSKPEVLPPKTEIDTKPKITGPWDKELIKLGGYLPLPQQAANINAFATPQPVLLTQIPIADPKDVDLIIHSPNGNSKAIASEEKEGFILNVENPSESQDSPNRKWVVQRKLINQLTLDGTQKLEVGSFELADQQLKFLWEATPPKGSKHQSLQYCLLEIRNGKDNQSHKFRLSSPKEVPPLAYDLSGREQHLFLETKSGAVDDPRTVLLDLTVVVDGKPVGSRKQLQVKETETFKFSKGVELDVTFQHDENKGPYLAAQAFARLKMVVDGNEKTKADPNKPIGRITGLGRLREDVDQLLIEERRLNINRTDLDRIEKEAKTISDQLGSALNLKVHQREVQKLNEAIGREKDREKKSKLEGDRRRHQKEIDKYIQRMQVVANWVEWAGEMKPYFEELGQTTQISYSIYTMIDGEKIFLARSEEESATEEPAKERPRKKPESPKKKEEPKKSPEKPAAPEKTAAESSSELPQ